MADLTPEIKSLYLDIRGEDVRDSGVISGLRKLVELDWLPDVTQEDVEKVLKVDQAGEWGAL